MSDDAWRALAGIKARLDWAETAEHAWQSPPFHVEGLHRQAEELVLEGIADAVRYRGSSPLGAVIQGQGGVGKTHLLGWVRRQVEREDGYFFLVDFSVVNGFWKSVLRAMADDLGRAAPSVPQVCVLMRRLASVAGLDEPTAAAVAGEADCTREDLDRLVDGLVAHDRRLGVRCADTLRALALYASTRANLLGIGYDYLTAAEEAEAGDRSAWGMGRRVREPQDLVAELSMLLAATGPSVIAIDQIDALLDHAKRSAKAAEAEQQGGHDPLQEAAGGIMALRHMTQRTLCLVACLTSSWNAVEREALETVRDRFRTSLILNTVHDPETARALVAQRIAAALEGSGFTPPDPTWPVAPGAFATAPGHTPRTLLQKIAAHIGECRRKGEIRLLESFDDPVTEPSALTTPPAPAPVVREPVAVPSGREDFPDLDARFEKLRLSADVDPAFDHETEDTAVPPLLRAALTAWIKEAGDAGHGFSVDPLPGQRRPEVHARLRRMVDQDTERQEHWAFRAIGAPHHRAALKRLEDAYAAAGPHTADRTLIVLRNAAWSEGEKTRERLRALVEGGGCSLPLTAGDMRTFAALETLLAERPPALDAWLRERRPASGTELLTGVLGHLAPPPPQKEPEPVPVPAPAVGRREPVGAPAGVRLGDRVGSDEPVEVAPATLTRHTVVFAGSGSGKTVLLRRIVEECALRGVSSIVLDSNNDLARLGDAWPEPPEGWGEGDKARAEEYLAETETVVWTPGRSGGRPLSFRPLPDFSAVRDDPDEFSSTVDVALAELSPRAGTEGTSTRAALGRAVLREALCHFGKRGGDDFGAFLALLSDLPLGVSQMDRADQIAADLAQALKAATINDPLFAGGGEPVDPELLLTPSPGKRARVSVVNLVGLAEDRRPGFVSRLQMALFSWIKRHPAGDRPLGALYVMDEAQNLVPATPRTAALASTLTLASQARKYGLGLVFATQAPKGMHNQITGNATTQLIGRINHPTQTAAVKELARSRGGTASRVGKLERGQFYFATEGVSELLLQAPLCLSHHPPSPLTEPEIMARARKGTG